MTTEKDSKEAKLQSKVAHLEKALDEATHARERAERKNLAMRHVIDLNGRWLRLAQSAMEVMERER